MPSEELERIASVYAERERALPADRYSLWRPGNLYIVQRREQNLLEILAEEGFEELSDTQILDVGCGSGEDLRQLLRYGATAEKLIGVDVLPNRLERARALSPHLRFELIDGTTLPFPDASFDLVWQSTVFSSIIDPKLQNILAAEMRRVLKPSGAIFWYDMRVTNPKNHDLVPLTMDRVAELFPGYDLILRPHTLLPFLARPLAPYSRILCELLELLPPLRGHLLGLIRPRGHRHG